MAKSATHFQPTVDTFGELTLRARRLGSYFTDTTWTGAYNGIDRKALTNTLIMVVFLLGFAAALTGLFAFDQMAFEGAQQTQAYYGGVPLDYN